jgi:hypothetical protein
MSTFEASSGKSKVQAPAIALIVVGALYCFGGLYGLWGGLTAPSPAQVKAEMDKARADLDKQMKNNPQAKKEEVEMANSILSWAETGARASGAISTIWGLVLLVIGGTIIFGATQMMSVRSFGMAITSSILAVIPCTTFCCVAGVPIGIWSLIVLNNPDVKIAFREAREGAV